MKQFFINLYIRYRAYKERVRKEDERFEYRDG